MINLLNIPIGNEIKMQATIATSIRLPTIVFNDDPNESFSLENTSPFTSYCQEIQLYAEHSLDLSLNISLVKICYLQLSLELIYDNIFDSLLIPLQSTQFQFSCGQRQRFTTYKEPKHCKKFKLNYILSQGEISKMSRLPYLLCHPIVKLSCFLHPTN